MENTDLIKVVRDVRIRNIGDEVFLLPLGTAGSTFYKMNQSGEMVMCLLMSYPLNTGVPYETLLHHMKSTYPAVDESTLKCDLEAFVIQLKEVGLIEI